MKAERWRQIEAVFHAASDLPPGGRGALLDEMCAGDADLRAEVESLLESALGATEEIRGMLGREAALLTEATRPALADRRIGPYRLLRELGQGGMGAVYLAARDDDHYRAEVAIKLLHRGLETARAVARFRDERQILASLQHPGIVRLLDGGSTEDGLPYLVMEHVEGEAITRYADTRGLSVRARVTLLREVCSAVAYAHQRLVVHRDLKPSNILVTSSGAPKLLDFGIAKLLDASSDVGHEATTRAGTLLLTPQYASPEQVRGEPASTSTDVYSLGAVLYELCAGVTPHEVDGVSLESLRALLEVDPPPPSTIAPAAFRRELAGDLDNILLKALQKDPHRRYSSVEQLSEDLGRYLDGLPVLARPATYGYRAAKFIRRSRGPLAALAIVLTSLSLATGFSVRQARRADEQARRADEQARRADEQARRAQKRFDDVRRLANTMLFEVDGKLESLEGATGARDVLVSRALEYLDSLASEANDDAALARDLAAAYVRIGDIQGNVLGPNLGRPKDALASYTKGKLLASRLAASEQSDPAARWVLARALFGIGSISLVAGDMATARASLLEVIAIAGALPRDASFDDRLVLNGHVQLFQIAIKDGDLQASELYGGALLGAATRWAEERPSPDARYWVGIAHEATQLRLSGIGDPEAALRELGLARVIFTDLVAEYPLNAGYRRELWVTHVSTAASLTGVSGGRIWDASTGDVGAAEAVLGEARASAERRVKQDPKDSRAAHELAVTLDQIAATIAERDPAASVELSREARRMVAALPADVRESSYADMFEWFGQCAMAVPLAKLGRRADALSAIEAGLAIATRGALADKDDLDARLGPWMCRSLAARARMTLGDTAAAAEELSEIAAGLEGILAARPAFVAPYLGLVDTMTRLASIRPERRCDLLGRAARGFRSWPGVPTAFTKRRTAALESALADCPR